MVVDLWVYCNPTGNILTTYYANQIRQGDSFMMRVCFPYEEATKDDYTNMIIKASFSVLNQEISVCNSLAWDGVVKKFPGMGADTRDIGELKKGKEYIMYDIFVDANAGVTTAYGSISYWLTKVQNSVTKNIGTGTISIQRTYGNNKMAYITPTEYSNILKEIEAHSVVAKQYMSIEDDYIEEDENNKLIMKSWCGLGFINGLIKFKQDIVTGDEFVKIAYVSSGAAKLSYPATILGVIYQTEASDDVRKGTDVQFRVDNDSNGHIVLSISPYSTVVKGDVVSLYGCVPYNADALRFVEKDADGKYETTKSIVVGGANCEVTTYDSDNNPDGLETGCTYTLEKDDTGDTYLIKFKFTLPVKSPSADLETRVAALEISAQSDEVKSTSLDGRVENLENAEFSTMVDDTNVKYVKSSKGVILGSQSSGNFPWLMIKNKAAYTFKTDVVVNKNYVILAKNGNAVIILDQRGNVSFIDDITRTEVDTPIAGFSSSFSLPCEIVIVDDTTVKFGSNTLTMELVNKMAGGLVSFEKFQLGCMCKSAYANQLLGFSFAGTYDDSKWNCLKKGIIIGDDSTGIASKFDNNIATYGDADIAFINAAEESDTFVLKIPSMVTDIDFIVFLGGQNDWKNGVTLGSKDSSSTSTFYNAVNETFSTLRNQYTSIPIFVSTILPRNLNGTKLNANDQTIEDYNEIIKYHARQYGMIVIDGYAESGINYSNLLKMYSDTEGVLSDTGYTRIAQYIKDKMEQYTPYKI